MLWKIYVWVFLAINVASLVVFDYRYFQALPFASLILSVGLNIAVFSYAYRKQVLPKQILVWLFKLNLSLIGIFVLFEVITFFQEIFGVGINLPTSGVVAMIASFPSLPALYATYLLAYPKTVKAKKKSKKKA